MPLSLPRARGVILLYGAVLLLVASLAGLPFAMAIKYDWGEDAVRAWRVAHTSILTGGLLALAIGAVLDHLVLSERAVTVLARAVAVMAWMLFIVTPLGAATGERGVGFGASVIGTVVAVGNTVMGLASFTALILLIVGGVGALRQSR